MIGQSNSSEATALYYHYPYHKNNKNKTHIHMYTDAVWLIIGIFFRYGISYPKPKTKN